MATTARDQIYAALRLIGQLAEGETPSAATAADALSAMNQMLDSWSTERLSVFSTQDQVFTWGSGIISRTLGPTGDFVGDRPVAIDDATYFRDPSTNVSYGIKLINQQQYNGIAVKTVRSTYPQVMWVNMSMPDIDMHLFPVPQRNLEFHIVSVNLLGQVSNLSTPLVFPPGYLRAFKYNLACEIASDFGVAPPPFVSRIATVSKRNLKRVNNPNDMMMMPYGIIGNRQRYNVFAGNY